MRGTDTLDRFLQRVRRRYNGNVVLSQTSVAMTTLMGGIVVLLFFGTQIFEWYWLVVLLGISATVAALRIRRNVLGEYALAQLADRRLNLNDSLSTAWFFGRNSGRGSAEMRAAQRELAEAKLRTADPRTAVPLGIPRVLYAAGALAVLAFGMVAVRYGSYQALALRVPVAPGVADLLRKAEALELLAQARKPEDSRDRKHPWQESGIALDPKDGDKADGENRSLTTAGTRDAESSSGTRPSESKDTATVEKIQQKGQGTEEASGEQGSEAGEQASASDSNQGDQGSNSGRDGKQQNASNQQNASAQSNQPGANSSLMSKMRDAMSNLLSKLQGRSERGGQQQGASGQKGSQQGQKQAMRQRGNPSSAQQQTDGRNGGQMQGDSQGDPTQNAQEGNGRNSQQQSSDRRGSPDAKSGVGKEDGDKDLAAAEQLAAMGKISEILGRRSRNITGDITVEVNSGRQQLRTAYSQKNAGHVEAAGEIHRDEVPLVLQAYVQQYFEQIRKSTPRPKQR